MGAALTVALEPALAPQDDHQRLVTKAFSNDDAGELARAKQEVAFRDAKIKKLDDALRKEKELHRLAQALLEYETLDSKEVKDACAGRRINRTKVAIDKDGREA